jgi:uncharacterized protein with FMN-binding domain
MRPKNTINKSVAGLIVIVLLGIVTTAVISSKSNPTNTSTDVSSRSSTDVSTSNPAVDTNTGTTYKDGTYTATGTYATPENKETIGLTVTIANDAITDVSLSQSPTSGESREYQQKFLSGYKSLVIGKKIDGLSLSRVAGSSLTSNGFNAALDEIRADAAA